MESTTFDKRSQAREAAIQALYQLDILGAGPEESIGSDLLNYTVDAEVRRLAWPWVQGTWQHLAECDQRIKDAVLRWQFSRLAYVDRAILRLAVYQLLCCGEIPPKVVINEAIELAKRYSTEKASGFVNGVLDAILRKHAAQTIGETA